MARKICIGLFVLLSVGLVGFYFYDVFVNHADPMENLLRMLAIVVGCIAGIARVMQGGGRRRPLSFYESHFAKDIKDAFADAPANRKKLLEATRLYDEDQLSKAVKLLIKLKKKCKQREDYEAVGLFLALTLTDMGAYLEAANEYNHLIHLNPSRSTYFGNLGMIHYRMNDFKNAMDCYKNAIAIDPTNAAVYNNIASLYFDEYKLDEAIEYAHKALKANPKFRQSASLLAIIYSIKGNKAESEKYFHIAVASGESAEVLKDAIAHYLARPVNNVERAYEDELVRKADY